MLGKRLHEIVPSLMRTIRENYATAQSSELSFHQIRMLYFISCGKSQSEMAEIMSVTPAAVSKIIDGMVVKKLLLRKQGEDRRRQILTLTASGKKTLDKINKTVEDKLNESISQLSSTEYKQLEQGLAVLEKLMVL